MEPKQDIVSIRLDQASLKERDMTPMTAKPAFQLTDATQNLTICAYNGIDKYILYALLKGFTE